MIGPSTVNVVGTLLGGDVKTPLYCGKIRAASSLTICSTVSAQHVPAGKQPRTITVTIIGHLFALIICSFQENAMYPIRTCYSTLLSSNFKVILLLSVTRYSSLKSPAFKTSLDIYPGYTQVLTPGATMLIVCIGRPTTRDIMILPSQSVV